MNGAPGLMVVELVLRATNDDILDKMRVMRQVRTDHSYSNVVCVVSGFGDDPRELFDVPEVRGLCRRLMTLGFGSYLDPTTTLAVATPGLTGTWGAFEIWMCGEGKLGPNLAKRMNRDRKYARTVLADWRAMLDQQNAVADAAIGPSPE
ncbi:MAG TPA: hypothetical protein VD866_02735 [Urbifossiella sp.]|nr:hypothetical protein [Urbifossiella sp.]